MKKQPFRKKFSNKSSYRRSYKCLHKCSNNKGETIVEVMVAFVLLLVYLTAITALITTATRITALTTHKADEFQEQVNQLVLQEFADIQESQMTEMLFAIDVQGETGENSQLAVHPIYYMVDQQVVYFIPQ